MKRKTLNDFRAKDIGKLMKEAEDKKLEIAKLQAEMKVSNEKNLKKAKMAKRDLSQILTLVKEKEILEKETKGGDSQ